jgi:hypothetical protein
VLDSAAMYLALSPNAAPTVKARLCLRSGFQCFGDIARALGYAVPLEPDASQGISLTYDDFLKGIKHMHKVDFPLERDPADAWPDFVGWRVNYEQAAYAVARDINAVPALWSGPRKHKVEQMAPFRPAPGRPTGYHPAKGRLTRGRPSRNHRAQERRAQERRAEEQRAEEHSTEEHRPGDHRAQEHPAKPHTAKDHTPKDHVAKDLRPDDGVAQDHRPAGDGTPAATEPSRQDVAQPSQPSTDNPPA